MWNRSLDAQRKKSQQKLSGKKNRKSPSWVRVLNIHYIGGKNNWFILRLVTSASGER